MLALPITAREVLEGLREASALPENARQERPVPRASGLASCARATAYDMEGLEATTDWGRPDITFTQEQGRVAEDLTVAGINASGRLRVVNRQVELPDNVPYTGHPDGEVEGVGDGLHWGFEHKHFGEWKYNQFQKYGLECEPGEEVLAQAIAYGMSLGWDAVLIAITSQDASVIFRDTNRAKKYKDTTKRWPDFVGEERLNPKLILFAVDLREYYPTLGPRVAARAEQLAVGVLEHGAAAVQREADPSDDPSFPCSYCQHYARCRSDGEGRIRITPIFNERNG